MGGKRTTFFVEGMTCSSCESRIASALRKTAGVSDARASLQGGTAWVEYDEASVSAEELKASIVRLGYTVKARRNAAGTLIALGIGLVLVAAYMIATQAGLFSSLPKVDASIGYGMLFVIGLLTSVHCVAMCGGIALSQSLSAAGPSTGVAEGAPQPTDPVARTVAVARLASLSPGLLYNAGRILSYTIVGALVGVLGSAFNFSPIVRGLIAAVAGLFMLLFGLNMLGLVARLPSASRLLPTSIRKGFASFGAALRKRGPFAVGLLNGLMPCGPLQTMQLYALGTGSALAGALSMFIFSAGTVPLMLVFGLAATLLPRRFVPVMVRASAVLVMFLGVVTFARAASMAGVALPSMMDSRPAAVAQAPSTAGAASAAALATTVSDSPDQGELVAKLSGGGQTITTAFTDGLYVPFTVQAGVPLKWIIRVTEDDLNGCNNPVTVPSYGIKKTLVPGDNLIEFTPKAAGVIGYTCWMGMIHSRITVVADLGNSATLPSGQGGSPQALAELLAQGQAASGDQGSAQAGGCCSGGTNAAYEGGRVPVDRIGLPVMKDGLQEIIIDVSDSGYSPAAIVLQKGVKAVIKFRVSKLSSCNYQVVFPAYNGVLDLSKGQLETPPIGITSDFSFQCGMGMLNGYVKTVDNIAKADLRKIKAEIGGLQGHSQHGGLLRPVMGVARTLDLASFA